MQLKRFQASFLAVLANFYILFHRNITLNHNSSLHIDTALFSFPYNDTGDHLKNVSECATENKP